MINTFVPITIITKNSTPIIYLDTNVLIELSRYEKGCCKNKHRDKIGELYRKLEALKQEKRILCACGNQMEEMGVTQARQDARDFLLRFTNVEFMPPFQIKEDQQKIGYQTFVNKDTTIVFNAADIIEKTACVNNTSIEVYAVSTCSKDQAEKLKRSKEQLAMMLNTMKDNGKIATDYDSQLELELKADYQVFQHNLEHYADSQKCFKNMLNSLSSFISCVRKKSK